MTARFLVRGPMGGKAAVTFRNRGETSPRTVELTAVEEPEAPKPFNVAADLLLGSPVEVRRLPSGPGYVRVKFELPALLISIPKRTWPMLSSASAPPGSADWSSTSAAPGG